MQKRCRVYLEFRKQYEDMLKELSPLYLTVATPASFPDSGYYYSKKERECTAHEEDCKAVVPKKMFEKWQKGIMVRVQRAQYNYYEKIQVMDKNGRGWTAAEMDAMMAKG